MLNRWLAHQLWLNSTVFSNTGNGDDITVKLYNAVKPSKYYTVKVFPGRSDKQSEFLSIHDTCPPGNSRFASVILHFLFNGMTFRT